MRILEPERALALFTSHPWAIDETKWAQLEAAFKRRARGEDVPEAELEAIVRTRRAGGDKPLTNGGGVAVIPIFGTISHRMDAFEEASGGTSVEKLDARIQDALASDEIGTIVFQVDSPGGSVYGIAELAQKIYEARGRKRMVAVADPLMASAAYWLGCSADEVVVTPSGLVGSIGVFSVHAEFSKSLEDRGVKVSVIRAGKFKAEGNPYEPLSDEARGQMQRTADDYYGMFVAAVARHRGVSEDDVRNGMGQGRALTAERALADGLVNRIATFEQVMSELGIKPSQLAAARASDEQAEPEAFDRLAAIEEADRLAAHHTAAVAGLEASALPGYARDREPLVFLFTTAGASTAGADTKVTISTPGADAAAPAVQDKPATTQSSTPNRGQGVTMADNANGAQEGAQKNGGAALDVRDIAAERDRASQIADLCAAVGLGHRAGEMIESKASVTEVREKIRGEAEQSLKAMAPGAGVQLTDREVKRYSLTKAIMARAEQGENWSGLEREISDQIAKNLPSSYKMHGGIMVPTNLRPDAPRLSASNMYVNRMRAHIQSDPNMSLPNRMRMVQQLDQMQAALDATNATQGGNTVFTEAGEFLDLLRARMQVAALGATILTGLRGPVAFPKQSGAGTFSWVAEDPGSDLSDSDLAIAQVALNPKAGSSTTAYTRQLLTEASIDVDNLVKMDLAKITALGIDAAAIAGTGGSNSPTGILSTSGIGSVAIGTDGGVPTYSHVVDLETEVAIDNADIGSMAYLTTPGIRGRLKKTEEFALANGRPVWTGGMQGELNGYPAAVSTQVPSTLTKGASSGTCHAIIFGVWAELIVGYWGAFELVVDPYSKKKQGLIELTSFQMAGIAVKHAEAFAACKDAKTS